MRRRLLETAARGQRPVDAGTFGPDRHRAASLALTVKKQVSVRR
jgi:hypothetical protein